MDDLLRYSAAGLDLYTVALGQQLCAKFTFSQLGHRNLITAFDSLPGKHYSLENFEIGYGAYHILPSLLKTDTGFTLAAIIGSLAEYFQEDIVVSFLMLLAERSELSVAERPLKHQWSRLVNVFHGVLSTSTFGSVLSDLEDRLPSIGGDLSVDSLLETFTSMSNAVKNRGQTITVPASAGYVWLATAASWLFDLEFVVNSSNSQIIFASSNVKSSAQAHLVFSYPASTVDISNIPSGQHAFATTGQTSGGRVSFEKFFQSSFGNTSLVLREKALAASVCCGLAMVNAALQTADTDLHSIFLSPENVKTAAGSSTFEGLLLAWFPELRRHSTHFNRYGNLSVDEARAQYDDAMLSLTEQCTCSTCASDLLEASKFCEATIAEFIITLALYISPMIVAPKLQPKRNGVIALYGECHDLRMSHTLRQDSTQSTGQLATPSEAFLSSLSTRLPSAAGMLRISTLLFANVTPTELDPKANVMGITSTGLTVFLTCFKQASTSAVVQPGWNVSVMVSPGWMCLFGHEARLEVYEQTYMNWSFVDQWHQARTQSTELQQIVKWKGRVMVTSVVYKGSKEEAQAEADGWGLLE